MIGYSNYNDLKSDAEKEYLPVNTFCLRLLREKIPLMVRESQQPYLPGITTINPIHATFRGGHTEPLHLWYPLLEGYSPEFVENILSNFAPNSTCVFDPFAGTGTTPLTAARYHKIAFYCEINPLLQHLIDIKIKALTLEDAKEISLIPPLEIDAVITSLPYLKGTNYFRNTKIELWFLRCLHSQRDLTFFREKSVTAGINDVSQRKNGNLNHPAVDNVVSKLKENAYDPRIPKMVKDYFTDMDTVFESLKYHLKHNAIIAVDIGDSIYEGVHVPTDRILTELMLDKGYSLKGEVLLRKRLSRR